MWSFQGLVRSPLGLVFFHRDVRVNVIQPFVHIVGWQAFKTDQKLIACNRIEIGRKDFPVHLIFQAVEQRAAAGMDQHLRLNQHIEILMESQSVGHN